MTRRYVIVGTGIAGLSAAEAVRVSDPRAEITLVGQEEHPFYSRPGLAYLLTGAIPERQLSIRTADDLRELAVERCTDVVTRVDPGAHRVELARGNTIAFDRLLLATGSVAVRPDVEGAALDGVVFLDDLTDARAIVTRAKRARIAVVVGGGPTAVELAEGLHARGLRVHYLLRGGRYWASVLDPFESRIVEDALQGAGIELHRRTQVARILGREGRVVGVETASGERIDCELVAVAIGVRPRAELGSAAGLTVDRGIVVDDRFVTSHADVLAAGDVAQLVDGRLDVLWSSAVATGRAAGRSMAGASDPFVRAPSMNVTRLCGIATTVVGAVGGGDTAEADLDLVSLSRGDSAAWRATAEGLAFEDRRSACRVRVLVGGGHVLGVVVMGDPGPSRALARLVRDRVDVSGVMAAVGQNATDAIARLIALGDQEDARAARA